MIPLVEFSGVTFMYSLCLAEFRVKGLCVNSSVCCYHCWWIKMNIIHLLLSVSVALGEIEPYSP